MTGVSRGLGRAMAEGFIAVGHTLCGCSRSPEIIAELRKEFPTPHDWQVGDVSDDAQVRQWAVKMRAQGPAPDILVNNAATINRNARLWEVPAAEFDRVLATNVSGVVNVIRHFAPAMVQRSRGVIVNFSAFSVLPRSTTARH